MPGFAALGVLVLMPLAAYASFAAADLHAHQRASRSSCRRWCPWPTQRSPAVRWAEWQD
jgi:hypothetical protein